MTAIDSIAHPASGRDGAVNRGSSFVKARSLLIASLMLATTACGGGKVVEDGGVYTRRAFEPSFDGSCWSRCRTLVHPNVASTRSSRH